MRLTKNLTAFIFSLIFSTTVLAKEVNTDNISAFFYKVRYPDTTLCLTSAQNCSPLLIDELTEFKQNILADYLANFEKKQLRVQLHLQDLEENNARTLEQIKNPTTKAQLAVAINDAMTEIKNLVVGLMTPNTIVEPINEFEQLLKLATEDLSPNLSADMLKTKIVMWSDRLKQQTNFVINASENTESLNDVIPDFLYDQVRFSNKTRERSSNTAQSFLLDSNGLLWVPASKVLNFDLNNCVSSASNEKVQQTFKNIRDWFSLDALNNKDYGHVPYIPVMGKFINSLSQNNNTIHVSCESQVGPKGGYRLDINSETVELEIVMRESFFTGLPIFLSPSQIFERIYKKANSTCSSTPLTTNNYCISFYGSDSINYLD